MCCCVGDICILLDDEAIQMVRERDNRNQPGFGLPYHPYSVPEDMPKEGYMSFSHVTLSQGHPATTTAMAVWHALLTAAASTSAGKQASDDVCGFNNCSWCWRRTMHGVDV